MIYADRLMIHYLLTHTQWDEVRHQLGIVTSAIRAAAKILRDVNTW